MVHLVRSQPLFVADSRHNINSNNRRVSLNLADTDRGLLLNRLTTTQRDAIADPVAGTLIYNTTTNQTETYNGSEWVAGGEGGGNSATTGFGDFTATLNTAFGVDRIVAHYPLSESTTDVFADISNREQAPIRIDDGAEIVAASGVADGNTGVRLHSNTLYIPYMAEMWSWANQTSGITIGFTVRFQSKYDYIDLRLYGANGTSVFRLYMGTGFSLNVIMRDDDNQVLQTIEENNSEMAVGQPYFVTITLNTDLSAAITINDREYNMIVPTGTVAPTDPETETGPSDSAMTLEGGSDSPVVSHFFITADPIYRNQREAIWAATGFKPAQYDEYNGPAKRTSLLQNRISNYLVRDGGYYPMSDYASPFLSDGTNTALFASNSGYIANYPSPINDGYGAVLMTGAEFDNRSFELAHFSDSDIVMGAAYYAYEKVAYFDFELRHSTTNDLDVQRARLSFTVDRKVRATLFNEDSNVYLEVETPQFTSGARVMAIMVYINNDDTLYLYVNGTKYSVKGGSGTIRTTIDGEIINTNGRSMRITGYGGIIGHTFMGTVAPSELDKRVQGIIGASGLSDQTKVGVSDQVDLGNGTTLVISNGLIVEVITA